jgi:hypothetical protein
VEMYCLMVLVAKCPKSSWEENAPQKALGKMCCDLPPSSSSLVEGHVVSVSFSIVLALCVSLPPELTFFYKDTSHTE